MSNRWFRFVIALVAIATAGAAGYRIVQHEQHLARVEASRRAGDSAAESAITTISEIKAALHAYVATGQGRDFWTARAGMLIDKLRGSFAGLDGAATAMGIPVTDELDQSERLLAADKRARAYLSGDRLLLAGEVIFTEARDLLDAMRIGIAGRRNALVQAADRQHAEARREERLLAIGAAGVLVMAVLVLVPVGRATAIEDPATLGTAHNRTAPIAPVAPIAPSPARLPKVRVGAIAPGAPEHRTAPVAPVEPLAPVSPLPEAAAVCTDLGRVSQSNEISALLGRAANVLAASGVIVWIASENRDELFPAVASGYDERLFERIGSITRDAANLTASAFRGGSPRTSMGGGGSAAAIAVPLLSPQGPVGVFSAELRPGVESDADRLALAAIFSAQLATLLGSMNANTDRVGEARAQNG